MSSIKNILQLCSFSTKSSKHMTTQSKEACQKSSQSKVGFSVEFGGKVNFTIHYSLFMQEVTIHLFAYLRRLDLHL